MTTATAIVTVKNAPKTEIVEQIILLHNMARKKGKAMIFQNKTWEKEISIQISSTTDLEEEEKSFIAFLQKTLEHFNHTSDIYHSSLRGLAVSASA